MDIENNKLIALRKQAYTKNRTIVLSSIGLIATIIILWSFSIIMCYNYTTPGQKDWSASGIIVSNPPLLDTLFYGFAIPWWLLSIFFCALLPSITMSIIEKRKTNSIKSIENILKIYYDKDFTMNQLKEPKYNNENFIFKFTDKDKKEYTGEISVSDTESIITTTYDNKPITISHEKVKSKLTNTIITIYVIIICALCTNYCIISSYDAIIWGFM